MHGSVFFKNQTPFVCVVCFCKKYFFFSLVLYIRAFLSLSLCLSLSFSLSRGDIKYD